jgi:hypothetical protein
MAIKTPIDTNIPVNTATPNTPSPEIGVKWVQQPWVAMDTNSDMYKKLLWKGLNDQQIQSAYGNLMKKATVEDKSIMNTGLGIVEPPKNH